MIGIAVVIALAGVLIGAFPLPAAVKRVEWYHYKPPSWVMKDFRVPSTEVRALTEMSRRDAIAPIADEHRLTLIERALAVQANDKLAGNATTRALLAFVAEQRRAGRLTKAQEFSFFQNAGITSFKVGMDLIAVPGQFGSRLNCAARLPEGFWISISYLDLTTERREVRWPVQKSARGLGATSYYMPALSEMRASGEHTVTAKIRVEVFEGDSARMTNGTLVFYEDRMDTVKFEGQPSSETERLESAKYQKQMEAFDPPPDNGALPSLR
jgi:hypothetical protein